MRRLTETKHREMGDTMKLQRTSIVQKPILQWQGGYRMGFRLVSRESWLDGICMGYTAAEMRDCCRQLLADRVRVGKPIQIALPTGEILEAHEREMTLR